MGLNGEPPDAVAIGGWGLDEHPPGGFDATELRPFVSTKLPEVYNIPLRSLYSKDVENLLVAGRNASCSHVAFTSTRVMATCAVMGQAAGTAAARCLRSGITPRELAADPARVAELQQDLLRDDQSIKGVRNEDPGDLARSARATASGSTGGSRPENVLDGFVRDADEGACEHRWLGPMAGGEGAWLALEWDEPREISWVQFTFDTGFHRELTLTSSDSHNRSMVRAPQPETVRDYVVETLDPSGGWVELARVAGNHQRLRRHAFPAVRTNSVRLRVLATNGSEQARVYEIRCYA
jgi:hypothetical protein